MASQTIESEYKILSWFIFGSKSSLDLDVMFIINKPCETKKASQDFCEFIKGADALREELRYLDKELNSNLCTIENKNVTWSYKGTCDEIQNSLIDTYANWEQKYPLDLVRTKRDVNLKITRTLRVVISVMTRSNFRAETKKSLKSKDLIQRLDVLKNIKFEELELYHKKITLTNCFKLIAFQLGQTLGLIEGVEVYSKEGVWKLYPHLSKMLMRQDLDPEDIVSLTEFKNIFVNEVEKIIDTDKTILDFTDDDGHYA
jgi:hypothetical protein